MTSAAPWDLDDAGLLPAARYIPSPNFDARPDGSLIELFTNQLDPNAHPYYRQIADTRVSSHFLIRRDGELIQFVSAIRRAWHAGQSEWHGRVRCNDF